MVIFYDRYTSQPVLADTEGCGWSNCSCWQHLLHSGLGWWRIC